MVRKNKLFSKTSDNISEYFTEILLSVATLAEDTTHDWQDSQYGEVSPPAAGSTDGPSNNIELAVGNVGHIPQFFRGAEKVVRTGATLSLPPIFRPSTLRHVSGTRV